eukprot:CAMPEP_0114228484 /NCGR_PEP_ID=MMETSP0058-20121206/2372_1 /TAXON_ID=36894 /ORGANISM="Pyramimonas parkeae, CCMP726" /LENGTH=667 /DNA_ID=CAMNT_0001339443 /DNA_START=409 /DNA_END=2413 /DNA_ORIENTATION=+
MSVNAPELVYKLKRIEFLGRSLPIVLQNENGPCPLLALVNILFLRNELQVRASQAEISHNELLSMVASRLIDSNANLDAKGEEYARNTQQNIQDAINMLPKLAHGLDVNVRFRDIQDFEYTQESTIFDLLDVSLVHGWLVDPQDQVTARALGDKSYNQLVEQLVSSQEETLSAPPPAPQSRAPPPTHAQRVDLGAAEAHDEDGADQLVKALRMSLGDLTLAEEAQTQHPHTIDLQHPEPAAAATPALQELDEEAAVDDVLDSVLAFVVEDATTAARAGSAAPPAPAPALPAGESDASLPGKLPSLAAPGVCPLAVEAELELEPEAAAAVSIPAGVGGVAARDGEWGGEEEEAGAAMGDAHAVECFLQETASQLTYYGLASLHQGVRERQLCVLFRNNHFGTLFRLEGQLYLLVTDQGYAHEPNLVWEALRGVDNDTAFATARFEAFEVGEHGAQAGAGKAWLGDAAKQAAQLLSQAAASAGSAATQIATGRSESATANAGLPVGGANVRSSLPSASLVGGSSSEPGQAQAGGGGDAGRRSVPTSATAVARPSAQTMQSSHSQVDEDADMALAMQLQAEFEEEARREEAQARQRQRQTQAQTQPPRPTSNASPPSNAPRQGVAAANQLRIQQQSQQRRAELQAERDAQARQREVAERKKETESSCIVA